MIPRYAPTYTWMDLIAGFQLSSNSKVEEELCSRIESLFNIQYVFLFGSGREALYAALKAYGHPGRVLIPAYNCIVVPEAIQFAGYSPTFVDIDRSSFNMTAESVERAITSDVKVVFLTHLFGIPCDIQSILNVLHEREIFIIEDAAPALGAEYQGKWVGSFGDATVISFQSTKVISGEVGGALLTNNRNFAQKVMELQLEAVAPNNAWLVLTKALIRKLVTSQGLYGLAQIGYRALRGEKMYEFVLPQEQKPAGFFSRCPAFTCAVILRQLDRLEWNLTRRRKLAQLYQTELSSHPEMSLPVLPLDCKPAWIQFPIRVNDKLAFYKHMQRHSTDVTWTYRYSCAESYGQGGCPNALQAAKTVVGLPTTPFISNEQVIDICRAANQFTG